MPFKWSDYLVQSEWLVGIATADEPPVYAEGLYRTATSRAYYCAFHSAMILLIKRKDYVATGEGTDHGNVLRVFQQSNSEGRRRIGIWLGRLRDRRRRADYDDTSVEKPEELARESIKAAKRIGQWLASQ